jgi:GT2 family glycosyltransferase
MRNFAHVDVSILIVSYNTSELTRAALDSIAAQTRDVSFEVIVIDNASKDGSANMIASHPSKPQLVDLRENIGFARANNLAANMARGRYLLLLNPDTVVLDRAIDKLVAFARTTPRARIWGGRTLFADGRLNPSSCWGRMTPWNLLCRAAGLTGVFARTTLFNGEAIGGYGRDTVRQVDIVSGCFFLIEKQLWDGLNGFDPLFFMYGEEADLCLRAHAFSARPVVTPEATIVHYGGASETARVPKMIRLLSAKASLIIRHWQPWAAPFGLLLLSLWPGSRALALTGLSLLAPTKSRKETAQVWREIWHRRGEWQLGYPVTHEMPVLRPMLASLPS